MITLHLEDGTTIAEDSTIPKALYKIKNISLTGVDKLKVLWNNQHLCYYYL